MKRRNLFLTYLLLISVTGVGSWLVNGSEQSIQARLSSERLSTLIGFLLTGCGLIGIAILIGRNEHLMKEQEISNWEETRNKGKFRYILAGVLKSILVILALNAVWIFKSYRSGELFSVNEDSEAFIFTIISLLIICIAVSFAVLRLQERRYYESLKTETRHNKSLDRRPRVVSL